MKTLILLAILMADPNYPPELVKLIALAESMKPIDTIPITRLTGQWLDTPKTVTTIFPRETGRSAVEWIFENGQWKAIHAGESAMSVYTQPKATRATIHSGTTEYVITGEFVVEERTQVAPSCDKNGDGVVNFFEFAEMAKTWGRE